MRGKEELNSKLIADLQRIKNNWHCLGHIRILHLIFVTHIILFLLIATKNTDFRNIRTEETVQNCITE